MKPTVGIIGFGIVGEAVYHGFLDVAEFKVYDIKDAYYCNSFEDVVLNSEFIFICVPTPTDMRTGKCDIRAVSETLHNAVKYAKNTEKIFIIKSTIVPETTQHLMAQYPELHVVFNPEFLTQRNYLLDFINAPRIIIGGEPQYTERVAQLYRRRFPDKPICQTDATSAELAKYFSNCILASQVGICNEFYDICDAFGKKYDDIMEMVKLDTRIGRHTDVPGYDGKRGFAGACFPKDLLALITESEKKRVNAQVLKAVWDANLKRRRDDILG